jgi:hypothetical protein
MTQRPSCGLLVGAAATHRRRGELPTGSLSAAATVGRRARGISGKIRSGVRWSRPGSGR